MEITIIFILAVVLLFIFVCCLYVPYRDESRYIKAELHRSLGKERLYWKKRLFELRRNLVISFIVLTLILIAFIVFLIII